MAWERLSISGGHFGATDLRIPHRKTERLGWWLAMKEQASLGRARRDRRASFCFVYRAFPAGAVTAALGASAERMRLHGGAIRCACNGTVVHRLSRSVLPGIRCLDHATLARISETHSAWPSSLSDSASQASSRASSKRTSKTDFT